MRHCDDYIDDPSAPVPLRRFLRYARWPAIYQYRASSMGVKRPSLFAKIKEPARIEEYAGYWSAGKPVMVDRIIPGGTLVRVVMASRFGDVGITDDLTADHGYGTRISVDYLDAFSAEVPE